MLSHCASPWHDVPDVYGVAAGPAQLWLTHIEPLLLQVVQADLQTAGAGGSLCVHLHVHGGGRITGVGAPGRQVTVTDMSSVFCELACL